MVLHALRGSPVDLPSFHGAAVRVFLERGSPYGAASFAVEGHSRTFPYLNPPPSLLLSAPLALFGHPAVHLAMALFNGAVLAALLALTGPLLRRFDLPDDPTRRLLVGLTLLSQPVALTFAQGQWNLLAALGLCGALLLEKRRPLWAGAALSLAIVTKPGLLLLLGPLFASGRLMLCLATGAGLLLWHAVAWLALPAVVWADWWTRVRPHLGPGTTIPGLFHPAGPWNQSLTGVLLRFTESTEFSRAPLAVSWPVGPVMRGLSALGWLTAMGQSLRLRRRDPARAWALGLVCVYLFSPISWRHHLVMLMPALLIAARPALAWVGTVASPRSGPPARENVDAVSPSEPARVPLARCAMTERPQPSRGYLLALLAVALLWALPSDPPGVAAAGGWAVLLASREHLGTLILAGLLLLTRLDHPSGEGDTIGGR